MNQTKQSEQSAWQIVVFFLVVGLGLLGVTALQPHPTTSGAASVPRATATPQAAAIAATPTLNPAAATAAALVQVSQMQGDPKKGDQIFHSICFACHGFDAKGIPGLGKPLIGSSFASSLTDAELVAFIAKGRDTSDPLNTTGQVMPPRGGNPSLTDQDLLNVVAYIRSLNQNVGTVALQPTIVPAYVNTPASGSNSFVAPNINALPTIPPSSGASGQADLSALTFVAPDVNAIPAGAVPPSFGTSGALDMGLPDAKSVYSWACASCHGADGKGVIPGVPDLTQSQMSDDDLLKMLSAPPELADSGGQYPHHVLGSYPALTSDQIKGVVDYLRTLKG